LGPDASELPSALGKNWLNGAHHTLGEGIVKLNLDWQLPAFRAACRQGDESAGEEIRPEEQETQVVSAVSRDRAWQAPV
jgi:hypothetical protein